MFFWKKKRPSWFWPAFRALAAGWFLFVIARMFRGIADKQLTVLEKRREKRRRRHEKELWK